MKAKDVVARALLAFVLVTIGFALGRETARRAAPDPRGEGDPAPPPGAADRVVVYHMHPTVPCAACNRIKSMTEHLLRTEFARELEDGRLEWKSVNFQEDEDLARRYSVVSSCVIVVTMRGGREVAHQRLDDVWTAADAPERFAAYVGGAVRAALPGDPT